MLNKYVIGVDGGNTKTDYFLFDTNGNFIDNIRGGTCSHEGLKESYEGTFKIMDENIKLLLKRNNIELKDVVAAAFGLAGCDIPVQQKSLEDVVRRIGFNNFIVDNDSFLGIKAGTKHGYGVCSINGTGTVAGGIDKKQNRLQVGGIGEIVGDEAGGKFIAKKAIRAVYDSLYRCGQPTIMKEAVMKQLDIDSEEKFTEGVSRFCLSNQKNHTQIVKEVFYAAGKGDGPALDVLQNSALQLARSTVGCINHLSFDEEVEVVLAGSVWVKAENQILFEEYKKNINKLTSKKCKYTILSVPPAIGAILWALELVYSKPVDKATKKRVVEGVVRAM